MDNLKKNILYQMAYRLLAVITPLITSPIISRALGVEKLGVYSATQAYVNYFMLFAMLGVEYYGQRQIAAVNELEEKKKTFWEIYTVQFISAAISICVYLVSIFAFPQNRHWIMIIQGLWVLSCLFDVNWFFFGIENFKVTVIRNFMVKLITTISIVLFIRKESDLYLYAFIMSGSIVVSQMLLWVPILKNIRFVKPECSAVKRHVVPIARLFIPMVAISVYHLMDKTMLDALSIESEVGYYYAADKLINIPLGLITAISTVMLTRITNIHNNSDGNSVESMLEKSSEFMIFISIAVGFGIAAISNEFVPFFFGKGYEKCIQLMKWFVPVLFIKSLSNIVNQQYLNQLIMINSIHMQW